MRKRRGVVKQGFTLLELLMVVIIIGILASMALPQYVKLSERARTAEALGMLSAIRSSEIRFRAADANNAYTTNLTLLDTITANSSLWNYSVSTSTANAVATRNGGTYSSVTLNLHLDNGRACTANTSAASDWGLPSC